MEEKLGKFEIREELGRGGMGAVYKAYDPELARLVALKVPKEELVKEPGFVERFKREARAMAHLHHQNIIQVHDISEADGVPFIVMEYIEGDSLAGLLRKSGPMPLMRAVDVFKQACEALDYAHRKDVIHRDLKPGNIMVDPDGVVKVMDFGLAKILTEAKMTATGNVLGTPQYMSPEQCRDDKPDHRSDIYSLGIVFFEMLSGQAPFKSESPIGMMHHHLQTPPPTLNSMRIHVPEVMEGVLGKLLAKKRQNRYQSAHEVVRDLKMFENNSLEPETLIGDEDPTTPLAPIADTAPVGAAATVPSPIPVGSPAATTKMSTLSGKRPRVLASVVVGVLACLLVFSLIGDTDVGALVQTAEAAVNDEQYREAIPTLQKALGEDPDNEQANFLLGLCHYVLGNPVEAEIYLAKVTAGTEFSELAQSLKASSAKQNANKMTPEQVIAQKQYIQEQIQNLAAAISVSPPDERDPWDSRPLSAFVANLDSAVPKLGFDEAFQFELVEALEESGRVDFVDREYLDLVLQEQGMSAAGLQDEATKVRTGRIIGANFIADISVRTGEDGISVMLYFVDTETSASVRARASSIDNGASVAEIAQQAAGKILEKIKEAYPIRGEITTVDQDAMTLSLNVGRDVGLEKGMTLMVWDADAPGDIPLGRVEVTSVTLGASQAKALDGLKMEEVEAGSSKVEEELS